MLLKLCVADCVCLSAMCMCVSGAFQGYQCLEDFLRLQPIQLSLLEKGEAKHKYLGYKEKKRCGKTTVYESVNLLVRAGRSLTDTTMLCRHRDPKSVGAGVRRCLHKLTAVGIGNIKLH